MIIEKKQDYKLGCDNCIYNEGDDIACKHPGRPSCGINRTIYVKAVEVRDVE